MTGEPWIGADLPGDVLRLELDAGGERWHLGPRPVHAGDELELLSEAARRRCPDCGEGCDTCDWRGYLFRPLWLPVRFEYVNARDGSGCAYLYPPLPGAGGSTGRIEVRKGYGLRLRWPRVAFDYPPEG